MSPSRNSALFYFFGRYRFLFIGIFLLMVAGSVMESVSVVAFFPIFSSLLNESSESPGGVLGWVNKAAELLPISSPIVAAAVLLIVVFVTKTFFTLAREVLTSFTGAKVHYDTKNQVMGRYRDAHYQYILDTPQGALIYNAMEGPSAVPGVLQTGARMMAALLKVITITAVLISILPWATLALVGVGLSYYAGMHVLSRKISYRLGQRKVEAATGQTITVNEFFSGFRQIVTFGAADWWARKFERHNANLREVEVKEAIMQAVPRPVMELSAVLLMLGLIVVIWLTSSGGITDSLPKVGVFGVALTQLLPPLTTIGTLRLKLMAELPRLELAHYVITGPIPTRHKGTVSIESFQQSIVFDNVSFAYQNREPLFTDLNLTFEKGQVTAIVGSSGAGKTSIVNLTLGLFEPTSGRITVDDVPLQDLDQKSWFSKIGFVSQEAFTYHASVAENVLIGREGRSQESISEAARIANADGFIAELPEGYETVVGERGMKVSGGQQQRLSIARAMLDSPDILIFDEATSNLDNISERLVQDAINKVSSDRTVIVIAHRLSTISHADKIVVFENGKMVEAGKHDELLSKDGHYARLAGTR